MSSPTPPPRPTPPAGGTSAPSQPRQPYVAPYAQHPPAGAPTPGTPSDPLHQPVPNPWSPPPAEDGEPGGQSAGAPAAEQGSTAGGSVADPLKSAAADQIASRVPYADKAQQAKQVLDAGRQGGMGAGAEEAAALGGAAAARAGATALTGGISDAAGAVAPQVNKAIDKIGEALGRGAYKAVAKVAAAGVALLVIVIVAVSGGVSSVVAAVSGATPPPGPSQEQCDTMPADWCDVTYAAQRTTRGKNTVPWTVLASIARVTTDFGRTSPYDTVDREPSRPTPPWIAANFAAADATPISATSGTVPYNSGALAWGGYSNGQIPASALCPVPWAPGNRLECGALTALVALNEKYKAEHDGTNLAISDSYRDLAGQEFQRSRWCAQGQCSNAAKPGTSNHGWAKAVDFGGFGGLRQYTDPDYLWMKSNGPALGWHHPPFMEAGGRGPFEPWHWEYRGVSGVSAAQAAYSPGRSSGGLSGGVTAAGATSSCVVATPSTPIGGQGREAEGPFLLLPAAAQELREDGGDPQNPCDAAEFVARALADAMPDVAAELGRPAPSSLEEAPAFWQAVITAAGIIASPDQASGECVVGAGTTLDVPVDQLIERIWGCEIAQARDLHLVSGASLTTAGTPAFTEYPRTAAAAVLISEAKTVAWAWSQYGAAQCVESAPTAGVFPLTAEQATANGAVSRCDVQANIRAAARVVLAGERTPVADRSTAGGPYAPMMGGWASLPAALGGDATVFPTAGPHVSWTATDQCSAAVTAFVTARATADSPFAALAQASSAPSDQAPYVAALGGWPEQVRAACGAATDSDLAAHAATITLAAASNVPGVGVPRADAEPTDPTAGTLPAPTAGPDPAGALAPRAATDGPTLDAQALLGLTNWFGWQVQAAAPGTATFGSQSVVSRLSSTGHQPPPAPTSASATAIAVDPWQQRATEWAIFYGGLVRPFDTHGERTGSLVASLTGAGGVFAATSGDPSAQATAVIEAAKKYLGTPYSWGGGGPNGPGLGTGSGAGVVGFDCSGLTEYAFAQAGYRIGGFTGEQKDAGAPVGSLGQAQAGDLLFFGSPIRHVGIYLGDNQMIHSPKPGDVVKISSLYETPVLIKRVIQARPAAVGSLDDWIGQALTVLYANGFPRGTDDPAALRLIIERESSGNPAAVNRTDSNAQAGHPSFGLMQTIPSTFDAYALPGYTDKADPISQVIAGSRYAQSRYGGLDNVPGVKAVRRGEPYVGY